MSNALLFAAAAFFSLFVPNQPAESSLAIVQAGVQSSEDAPFVTTDYRFQPGEYVYFTFDVSGFGIHTDSDTKARRISLSYEVVPEDLSGRPLTKPDAGTIAVELAPEDKNWTPKKRAAFLVPSGLAAGKFQIHVSVRDAIAKVEAEKNIPFRVGGISIQPTDSVSVEHFQFFRKEGDRDPLELPAYSAGDTVYMTFDMVGFKLGPGNQYRLTYGITVLRPDGKIFLQQPNAAEIEESGFYPAQFVPADFQVKTPSRAERGQYSVLLSIHDLVANQRYETKQAFTIE
jgi:hypothetical protein